MTRMHDGTFGHLCSQVVERDLVAARQADRSLGPQDLSRLASDYSKCIDSIFIFPCCSPAFDAFFFFSFSRQIVNNGASHVIELW